MKNFLLTPFLGFLLVLFLCSQAYSFSISVPEGNFKMAIDVYSIATDYSTDEPDNIAWENGEFTGFDNNGAGTGLTNTYGIFSVSSISSRINGSDETVWSRTDYGDPNPEYLVGNIWGLSDDYLKYDTDSNQYEYRSVGGNINFYKSDTNINTTNPPDDPGYGMSAEPDWDQWGALGDEDLWLSAEFTPGVLDSNPTTYRAILDQLTSPFTGNADGFLNVTGGSASETFDSDSFGFADLMVDIGIRGGVENGWTIGDDPVSGYATPEPSTLILFGLGLLGFAGLARKKFTNK